MMREEVEARALAERRRQLLGKLQEELVEQLPRLASAGCRAACGAISRAQLQRRGIDPGIVERRRPGTHTDVSLVSTGALRDRTGLGCR